MCPPPRRFTGNASRHCGQAVGFFSLLRNEAGSFGTSMAQTLHERRDQFHTLRRQQASALAYFDCFWIFAVVTLALILVVPLMKRCVAEKGARIGGE